MSVYQFPVSLGRYIRLEVPGDSLSAEEWDRMLAVLALFRAGLVEEEEDEPDVVTMSGQRIPMPKHPPAEPGAASPKPGGIR